MRATLFLDGRLVGNELVFDQPTDFDGGPVQVPTLSDEYESEAVILIRDDKGNAWVGKTRLRRERVTVAGVPAPAAPISVQASPGVVRFRGVAEENLAIGAAVDIDLNPATGRMVVRAARP